MATAMDLLLSNDGADDTFVISEDLRTVTVPKGQEVLGVYSDECVRTIHFSMPRFCDDTDLKGYNISICYRNNDGIENRAAAINVQSTADTITFDWTVGRDACSAVGKTSFSVCVRAFSDSVVTNEFNTAICAMRVLEGVETDYADQDQVADAIGPLVQETANALADMKNYTSGEAGWEQALHAENGFTEDVSGTGPTTLSTINIAASVPVSIKVTPASASEVVTVYIEGNADQKATFSGSAWEQTIIWNASGRPVVTRSTASGKATITMKVNSSRYTLTETVDKKVEEATNAVEAQFNKLGLSVVNGKICQTYRKDV